MTDTTELAPAPANGTASSPQRTGALSTMRLAELQGLASSLGLSGTAKMRKGDLVAAIRAQQGGERRATASTAGEAPTARAPRRAARQASAPDVADQRAAAQPADQSSRAVADPPTDAPATEAGGQHTDSGRSSERGSDRSSEDRSPDSGRPGFRQESGAEQGHGNRADADSRGSDNRAQNNRAQDNRSQDNRGQDSRGQDNRGSDNRAQDNRGSDNRGSDNRAQDNRGSDNRGSDNRAQDNRAQDNRGSDNRGSDNRTQDNRGQAARAGDDDDRSGRRRNRQRSRDRKRRGGVREGGEFATTQAEAVEQISDDDVLVPVAGILDVLDNYAFVRTSGYLPGPNDVYVPLGIVKKNGLRKGDAVTGAVKALRDGEQLAARQKFNALVRLDTVNGLPPEQTRDRAEFGKLTPLYPQERLRLETEQNILTTRIIDLVAPIGKGQRGLIVSPSKAGKTLILQAIANAIAVNNPEAHLMVVLVDERPEEVTDMQRAVKGEVIASTFDRPAEDHTTVAELAIERAKRLVEMGHDVVVLLDSITRLGRAYNLAAPASGRILSGGVDSSALYPPKRFFGAARNIEHGGSLTILATALVETGSKMDEVIFEEFKGTGNMELRLSRSLADRRIFPAVDINPSGTRREEILMANEELKIVWKLRRVLSALDQQQGIELLLDRLKKSKSNIEFLMQVQKTSSIQMDD